MLFSPYYAKNYAGIIDTGLPLTHRVIWDLARLMVKIIILIVQSMHAV